MNFVPTHIYREGNQVADLLAFYGVAAYVYRWWSTIPPFAVSPQVCDLSYFLTICGDYLLVGFSLSPLLVHFYFSFY